MEVKRIVFEVELPANPARPQWRYRVVEFEDGSLQVQYHRGFEEWAESVDNSAIKKVLYSALKAKLNGF